MEVMEGSYRAGAGKIHSLEDVAYYTADLEKEAERVIDDVWATFVLGVNRRRKLDLVAQFSSRAPEPLLDDQPPSYDDVIHDLPPEYSALPPLAQRKHRVLSSAPQTPRDKSATKSSALLEDRMLDVRIDFEILTGVREHKKKKPAAKKAPPPPSPPAGGSSDPPADEQTNGDGGGDGGDTGDAGGAGDGGDGGDGGDDWGDWNVSGKKKDKKKKEEEEEAERLAKEEEERKAAEESATKDLSWADDAGGGDDSWAGFNTVGKKKKSKVRIPGSQFQAGLL
jgi:hypothetical protein